MRPRFLDAPGEWAFALLMAASPIVGSIWVKPDVTFRSVLGVGIATVLGVVVAALAPSKTAHR
jgi:hypothetical protein